MKKASTVVLGLCALATLLSLASRGWWGLSSLALVVGWLVVWQRWLVHQVAPTAIMLVGLCLRLAWVVLVPTEPAVDFESYHAFAVGLANGTSRHLLFASLPLHELGYPLFLGGVYSLFGATAAVGRAVNVVLALWLLLVTRRLLAPRGEVVTRTGLMLVALWPGHIALSSLLGSENLFLPLLWTGVALAFSLPFTSGVVLGVAQAVRPPALMMTAVVIWTMRRQWRLVLAVLVGLLVSFGAYRLVGVAVGDTADRGTVAFSLLMGTNHESRGAWNDADRQQFKVNRFELGPAGASRAAFSTAFSRITAAPLESVLLMVHKFRAQWGDGAVAVTFAMPSASTPWLAFADAWALSLWVLALWRVRGSLDLLPLEQLALAALAGTIGSHLLLEANPRYALPWVVGVALVAAAAGPRLTRTL